MATDPFEKDRKFYQEHGLGGRMGFGKKPAVIVIDLQLGFTDPTCPLGGNLDRVVESCKDLIVAAHKKNIPVFFTSCAYEDHLKDAGVWARKVPALSWLKFGSKWVEIDPRLGKTADDILVYKKYPSGFFGTHLQATLTSMGVDGLIITGCTTSGCVRATCIDALQYGYRGVVPEECVGDRAEGPHAANLFDIGQKYCDVMPLREVLDWVAKYEPANE
ncbi:MAG: isochorismatase family protein [Deltaproteobacteria bacterium]|nr:isochorismatase family protein [Deltaproteobacteria bacterium]